MKELKRIENLMKCEDLIQKLLLQHKNLKEEHTARKDGYGITQETYDKWWRESVVRIEIEKRLSILEKCYEKLLQENESD